MGFKLFKWITRILALGIILFGLPFYFGYGNPTPFINPNYTFFDNLWLVIFPLVFIGLALGWKNEKIGGFLITIPILIGFILSISMGNGLGGGPMMIPFIIGFLYLILGYKK